MATSITIALAGRPSVDVLLARVRERKALAASRLPAEVIWGHLDADRR